MTKQAAMTAEQFATVDDLEAEWFPLPEKLYGKDQGVYIRVMRSDEGSIIEDKVADRDVPVGEFRRLVLMSTVVDEDDSPIFDAETIAILTARNRRVVESMFERACELNGFSKKDVDEIEKNSDGGQSS